MADERTYPSGVPCWIDVEPGDAEAAQEFYGGLFGWTFENKLPPEVGYYLIASLDGQVVAAIAEPEPMSTGQWNTYIATDDVDVSATAASNAGATVTAEPQAAGPAGRWAEIGDSTGGRVRLLQAGNRLGAQFTNSPGAWNFSDLHTGDTAAALAFYDALFEWEAGSMGDVSMWRRPGYGDHLAATVDPDIHERQAAIEAPPGFADAIAWLAPTTDGESTHWHVTFAVADRDDAVTTAERLGATVLGSTDGEWTRSAIIQDPQGAVLTLSQFTPPS